MQIFLFSVSCQRLELILGFIYFRNLKTPYKLFLLQIFAALCCESYGHYLGFIKKQNNLFVFNYFILIEAWLLGMAGIYFLNSKTAKTAIPIILGALSLVWGYEVF